MLYKRILFAVDGSKTSNLAFKEAIKLAKVLNAKLCILHVIEKLPDHVAYAIDTMPYQLLAKKAGLALLEKFKKAAIKNKVQAETKFIEIKDYKDRVSKKILQTTKSWKADLLVMGTHGRTGFNRLMLGSVADEMLKTVTIPILLVRGK